MTLNIGNPSDGLVFWWEKFCSEEGYNPGELSPAEREMACEFADWFAKQADSYGQSLKPVTDKAYSCGVEICGLLFPSPISVSEIIKKFYPEPEGRP